MSYNFCAWNIRGTHNFLKLDQVKKLISTHQLSIFAILETKLDLPLTIAAAKYVNPSWTLSHNLPEASYGRIMVLHNPNVLSLDLILSTPQLMHFHAKILNPISSFYISVVYAANSPHIRQNLFNLLPALRQDTHPWVVLGDFNSCLTLADKQGGIPLMPREINPLVTSVFDSTLIPISKCGALFSWNNRSRSGVRTFCNLDHSFSNFQALSAWPILSSFLPQPILSDHSPIIISTGKQPMRVKRGFKFYNAWVLEPEYTNIFISAWSTNFYGNPMYIFCRKLSATKDALREWAKSKFGSGNLRSSRLEEQLKEAQDQMMAQPRNQDLANKETQLYNDLNQALVTECAMRRQQLRIKWGSEGDRNTKFFHASVKVKHAKSNISSIYDEAGTLHTSPEDVEKAFLSYYTALFGNETNFEPQLDLLANISLPRVTADEAALLVLRVTNDEIKKTLFSMNKNSSGGPDGFNVKFFTSSWDIVGEHFCKAVQNFFTKVRMLKSANATNLVLIPKSSPSSTVSSFRPISCCNVVYKCISKIIATRLVAVLQRIISHNQVAFLPKRNILDNIMLAHELLKGYGAANNPSGAMLKLDLKKAYDSIQWKSIVRIMSIMGFPKVYVAWIYECLSTANFSLIFNGTSSGYFPSKQGIRQGDPLSSYLFIMVMEVFTCMLTPLYQNKLVQYHPKCKDLQITSLLFADDIMIFTRPDSNSIACILETISQFYSMTGLQLNPDKSSILFSGISPVQAHDLTTFSGMQPMSHDMNYLGLPLCSSRVRKVDCLPLYNKITAAMGCWANRFLTQAGRLVLIKSISFSMMVYWARAYILPKKLLDMVRSAMMRFFWFGSLHSKKIFPCSFSSLEKPKKKGGLGLFNIATWNKAAFSHHFDAILNKKDTLWVRWTLRHNVGAKSFWLMDAPQTCSWIWRSILNLRNTFKPLVQMHLSPSSTCRFWTEPWIGKGVILAQLFTYQQQLQSGIGRNELAVQRIHDNSLVLPHTSNQEIRAFWDVYRTRQYDMKDEDKLLWDDKKHTVSTVYHALMGLNEVPDCKWSRITWAAVSPSTDNLMFWKVRTNALLTRDKLINLGIAVPTTCELCGSQSESFQHLFFECPFVYQLWCVTMSKYARVDHATISSMQWHIIEKATKWRKDKRTVFIFVLKKLIKAIWYERNNRIFEKRSRTFQVMCNDLRHGIYQGMKECRQPFNDLQILPWVP